MADLGLNQTLKKLYDFRINVCEMFNEGCQNKKPIRNKAEGIKELNKLKEKY